MDVADIVNDLRTRMAVLETRVDLGMAELRDDLRRTRESTDRLEKVVSALEHRAGDRVMSRRERTTAWSTVAVAAVAGALQIIERLIGLI